MNLVEMMEMFPTQVDCIDYLERLRWQGLPECPHCKSNHVRRRKELLEGRIGRWNCHNCKSTFKVTHGTIFHGTKIPLQKWFLAILLMGNAKKSLSSCQLSRDLDLPQKTAWRIMMSIRIEMGKDNVMLQGIVEADETYIGGKKRRDYDKEEEGKSPSKKGRSTAKDAVLGAVARGGQVIAQMVDNVKAETITKFIKQFVDTDETEFYTDQFRAYNDVGEIMKNHETINKSEEWESGDIHTNTIEGFWSFVKRAWYGSHHHYSTGYTPLYLAEACYKYNYRKEKDIFAKFIGGIFNV